MSATASPQSLNLADAVLQQVQEFITAGTPFSRYEITKALREKVNNGQLEIPDAANPNPGSKIRFWVNKTDVDDIFDDLRVNFAAHGLPQLQVSPHPSGYRVFSAGGGTGATPTGTASSTGGSIPAPVMSTVPPTPSSNGSATVAVASVPFQAVPVAQQPPAVLKPKTAHVTTRVKVSITDAEIRRRVSLYMDRCVKANKTPTLKQVQSGIKRGKQSTGLSKNEIANVVKSLGFKI